jgi:hypothetical protein
LSGGTVIALILTMLMALPFPVRTACNPVCGTLGG